MPPTSDLFTCRLCGVQIPALIPLRDHPHQVFTALLIPHFSRHPEIAKRILAPPMTWGHALLGQLVDELFDGPDGFDVTKAE
jgi:hypothetical protein